MSSSQFYLPLPSNSNLENTASIFTTALPQNIHLEGAWECALVEIIYPNSWFNITEKDNLIEFIDVEKNLKHKIKIPRGRYETADELIDVLNSSIRFATNREKSSYENFLHFPDEKDNKYAFKHFFTSKFETPAKYNLHVGFSGK